MAGQSGGPEELFQSPLARSVTFGTVAVATCLLIATIAATAAVGEDSDASIYLSVVNQRLAGSLHRSYTADEMQDRFGSEVPEALGPVGGWGSCDAQRIRAWVQSLSADSNATYWMIRTRGSAAELNPALRAMSDWFGASTINIYFLSSAVAGIQFAEQNPGSVRTLFLNTQNILEFWALSSHGLTYGAPLVCLEF